MNRGGDCDGTVVHQRTESLKRSRALLDAASLQGAGAVKGTKTLMRPHCGSLALYSFGLGRRHLSLSRERRSGKPESESQNKHTAIESGHDRVPKE